MLYHLSYQGSPRILEWVAIPFSRRSSRPRDWTQVSHIVGRQMLYQATREVLSCIFSILVSRLFIFNSSLFSRFWIIFTIIIWNSLSGRFPISSSFVWFDRHLSCSFTCWVFLCLFILFILLCLEWPFCILAVCASFLLWRFLTVGGVGQMACQGFLVREACVGVLVGRAGFLLSGVQWSVQ